MSEWIIPFQGRNASLAHNQNLLWKTNNIYIMDNHRAALWCWLQEINKSKKYNVFHLDKHSDMGLVNDKIIDYIPHMSSKTITEYLELSFEGIGNKKFPIISWDNYLTIFLKYFTKNISELLLCSFE